MPNFTRYSVLFKERVPGSVNDRYLSALQGAIFGADTAIHWMQFKSREDRRTLNSAAFKLQKVRKNAN
jgi:hypothetical protein